MHRRGFVATLIAGALGWISVPLPWRRTLADSTAPPAGSGEAPETIDVELRLEGALDAVQREKLLEIAQRCPVHRTLRHGVTIRERLLS